MKNYPTYFLFKNNAKFNELQFEIFSHEFGFRNKKLFIQNFQMNSKTDFLSEFGVFENSNVMRISKNYTKINKSFLLFFFLKNYQFPFGI